MKATKVVGVKGRVVEARISLITLGVRDLARATAFYRDGLGWPLSSASVTGEVAFFRSGGVILGLFGRVALATDAGVPDSVPGFSGISLAHNVTTADEVDRVIAQAERAGATITKLAGETFFGRHGYFIDPDGHLWEVAWNPAFPFTADGSLLLPE